MRPQIPRADQVCPYLERMDSSGQYANFGPLVGELEERLAERLQTTRDKVVAVSSATLGISGALATAEVQEWRTPAWTFTATPAAVLNAGVSARFGDVDPQTWWLDLSEPSRSGDGVLVVAPFGAPVDRAPTGGGSQIVDAAASLGHDTEDLGRLGRDSVVVYSLHATKPMGIGEGGVVVVGDAERARDIRAWSNFGFSGSRDSATRGLNAKMPEVTAAYGLAVLDRWPQEQHEWLAARELTNRLTQDYGLRSAPGPRHGVNPYWVVQLPDPESRRTLEDALDRHRIGHRRWWSPACHRMAAYADLPRDALPHTEHLAEVVIGLPMYRGMSGTDAERIAGALADAQSRLSGA